MEELHEDNRIWWGKNQNAIPQIKRFLSEVKEGRVPQTLWSYSNSKSFKRYCILVQLREMEVFVLSNTLDK